MCFWDIFYLFLGHIVLCGITAHLANCRVQEDPGWYSTHSACHTWSKDVKVQMRFEITNQEKLELAE